MRPLVKVVAYLVLLWPKVQWELMTAVLWRCLAKAAQRDGPTKASTDTTPPEPQDRAP